MRLLYYTAAIILTILFSAKANAEPMKFAYFDQYAPRSYKENGVMKGIIVDIINLAVRDQMGIPVSHEGYPWRRAQALVRTGQADAMVTIPTPERRSFAVISKEPLLKFETFLATLKNHPRLNELKKVKRLEELKNFQLVDYFGNGWAKSALKDMNVTWLPDYNAIFEFLAQGRADAVIVSKKTIYSLQSSGHLDKFLISDTPLTSLQFHLCINKESEYAGIIDKFDSTLKDLKQKGAVNAVIESYY